MAKLPAAFNPKGQKGVEDYDALPPEWYIAKMAKSEMKDTNNQLGRYLQIEWLILVGEYAKRRVWQNLNLINPSEATVEIANRNLTSICEALSVPGVIEDTKVLHDKPCKIRLIVKPGDAQYGPKNEVRGYKALTAEEMTQAVAGIAAGGNTPTSPGAASSPAAQAAKAAEAAGGETSTSSPPNEEKKKPVPPWLRGK